MGCSVSSLEKGSGGVVLEVKTDGCQNKLNRNVNQGFPVGVSSRLFVASVCLNTLRVLRQKNTVKFKDW